MTVRQIAGIDAGGTMIKIAISDGKKLTLKAFPERGEDHFLEWLHRNYPEGFISMTGGGASCLSAQLPERQIQIVPEFQASCTGVQYLLHQERDSADPLILTNVGTGTSLHLVKGEKNQRLTGTGVGGGTILGLSALLTGIHDFSRLMELSLQGKRAHIDLTVAAVYRGHTPPIPGDLTASNFGNVSEKVEKAATANADLIASVIGLVAETITTLSVLAAEKEQVHRIVYIGGAFSGNPLLHRLVRNYSRFCHTEPMIPENGQFSGAVGALLMQRSLNQTES
ncbi:type II pantothenate kinase [Sporolactobacillus sp. Y61]|uniref:Type II pantothenate kinase n=1 Tax=Sporolactobacillus sp. Y61 TaxID=3160863 RepID=A0AAU8ICW9_9BACL